MLRTVFRSLALLLVVCTPVLAQDAKPEDVVVDQARGVFGDMLVARDAVTEEHFFLIVAIAVPGMTATIS